jgi:purine-binding chemotaxis protein CheW
MTANHDNIDEQSGIFHCVTFRIGEEKYALNIMRIREVREWITTTKLPNAPDYVLGVVDIRDKVVPVFDLKKRLGYGDNEIDETKAVMVLKLDEHRIGLLVDSVSDIEEFPSKDIKRSPEFIRKQVDTDGEDGAHVDTDYITGIMLHDNEMVIVLDADKIFSKSVIEQVA